MGFGILWFCIIMIIVVRCVNAAKGNGGRPGATRPPQVNRPGASPQGKWTGSQSVAPRPVQQKGSAYGQPARSAQQRGGAYGQPARSAQQGGSAYGQSVHPNDRRYAMPARPVQSKTYPAKKQNTSDNTILQRARTNAAEQFDEDVLEARGAAKLGHVPQGDEIMRDKAFENHIHSGHGKSHEAELRNQAGVDDYDTYHLINEVNDLIVKGYSGNLEFERDFLAEGMDMLNRVSM